MSNNKIKAGKALHHQKCLLALPIKVAQEVTSQRTDDKLFRNHQAGRHINVSAKQRLEVLREYGSAQHQTGRDIKHKHFPVHVSYRSKRKTKRFSVARLAHVQFRIDR